MAQTPLDDVHSVLTELLRLYDWRNEIGRIERDFNHDKKQVTTWLNRYGREKKAAWEAARRVLAVVPSAVARSDLADELARLGSKATQGPWSSNILQDFRGHSGSNDTPYVYGPESHPKLLMGLWPIHPPEETAAVEQRMFDTLDLICSLRNHLPEIIAALRTQSASAARADEQNDDLNRLSGPGIRKA